MKGIAKQRKQNAKFGDIWFMTRPRTFYREYTILKSRIQVIEYAVDPY